jgi:hypothetical protein
MDPIISWLVVIAYLFCATKTDFGWEYDIPADNSLNQSWQWWISVLVIIHLFFGTGGLWRG